MQLNRIAAILAIPVLVRFSNGDGTFYDDQFTGKFYNISQSRAEHLLMENNPETEQPYTNSEVLHEVLEGATGIKDGERELTPEEGKAVVIESRVCSAAAVAAFFRNAAPERYREKTSPKRRKG